MHRTSSLLLGAGALLLGTTHCLPGDDRPEPASLLVEAVPSEATTQGFVTDDGWEIRIDRFVTALGDVRLRDVGDDDGPNEVETCNDYAETYYEWLYDFVDVTEPGKVGLTYGLGECRIEFRFREPSDETVLGVGVDQDDYVFMLERGSDAYAEDREVALYVEGVARTDSGAQGPLERRFAWKFRRSYEISDCELASGDGLGTDVVMLGGAALGLTIEVRAEELFRSAVRDDAPLHFWSIGLSDLDLDGEVTLEELAITQAPDGALDGVEFEDPDAPQSGADGEPITLADLIYDHLLPRVPRLQGGGACRTELRD